MRLLINSTTLGPTGGYELQVFETSRELARRGHEIHLVYLEDGELTEEFRSFCASTTRVPSLRASLGHAGRDLVRTIPAIRAGLRANPDVVYLHGSWYLSYGVPVARMTRSPLVCHVHGARPMHSGHFLLHQVQRFISVSGYIRDQWVSMGVDRERIEVVHNGVDTFFYSAATEARRRDARQEIAIPDGRNVVLYMGRLDEEKGVDVLLEAWQLLNPEVAATAQLVVLGSPFLHPDPERYAAQLRARAPSDTVWLETRREVGRVLDAADLMVVPSVWDDPFPRAVLEPMCAGVPVVASRAGGIPEALGDEFASFLFERGDAAALADRLNDNLDWRRRDPGLGARWVARAHEHFSLGGMVDKVEAILRQATLRA
jgi:glycosyltransferase involved in cell wall biosynthesis